jgi:hypothetical protein
MKKPVKRQIMIFRPFLLAMASCLLLLPVESLGQGYTEGRPISELREAAGKVSERERETFWTALAAGSLAGLIASDVMCPLVAPQEFAAYLKYRAPATASLPQAIPLYSMERGCTRN